MIRKDTEPDPQPKWLRPIDPLVAASLPIRIDPRLGADKDTADRLRRASADHRHRIRDEQLQ
jgi:hypothetical protein